VPEESLPPIDLYAREEGNGPTVVLLHMVGGSHAVWNRAIPELAKEFRVIAPDLRGHGRTPAPEGSRYSLAELEGDVLRLLDSRNVAAAFVVGFSGGALLALRLALDHPDRVRGLVMISGSAYTDNHTRAMAQRWEETLAKEGADAFALRLLKDLYYPDWIEDHLDFADQVRDGVKHQDFGPANRWAKAMEKFDERSRIASVRLPTLIVQAMDDQVVDASHGRILRQSIPGAQIRILAQTGHMIPLERPAETVEALASFFRSVEARTAGGPAPG
jgi:pimeloyl-ACP methyl ester carboxylesterase